jgi:Beta-lactamase enzyme family
MPRSATEESSTPTSATEGPPAQTTIRASEIEEEEVLLARWAESRRRSRVRHCAPRPKRSIDPRPWALHAGVAAFLVAAALIPLSDATDLDAPRSTGRAKVSGSGSPETERKRPGPPPVTPSASGLREAKRFVETREGFVSFAAIDSRGRLHGMAEDRPYVSASVVKALLLGAELRRLESAGAEIDESTRTLLTQMITFSDNDAADAIYARVGDAGLYEVAKRAGMTNFTVSGYWANAQVTAADMAAFMWNLDKAVPAGKRDFGLAVFGDVIPQQSWGIPEAAGPNWVVRFKGGWRSTDLGQLVHQAAALRHDDGTRTAVAVLTDAQPTQTYGIESVRGVAERVLDHGDAHRGSSRPNHSE